MGWRVVGCVTFMIFEMCLFSSIDIDNLDNIKFSN